jgi:transposase-like protein
MKCPKCSSERINKNGHHHSKQNFVCKACGRQFVESYEPKGYSDDVKQLCLKMYLNGMGFRGIERVTGINHNTIINWVRIAALALPELPEGDEIPEITELDELQTFVGSKKTSFGSGLPSITGTQEL